MIQQNIMKKLTLNNLTKKYFKYTNANRKPQIIKNNKARFDIAEGLLDIPKNFKNTLNRIKLNDYSSLPDKNSSELKSLIADFLNIKNSNISIFSGSDEIIEIIPRIYLKPGDISLSVVPIFSRMITAPKKVGANSIYFKLKRNNNFKIEGEEFIRFINKIELNKPKIIWICSPNNPTGIVTPLNQIKQLIKNNPAYLFVINEVYQEYYSLDPNKSAASLTEKYSNLLVIRSFSKAFGLAGVRIGYVVGSEGRINEIEKFRTMYNISVFAQKLAAEALKHKKYVLNNNKFIKTERKIFINNLASNCNNIEYVPGSETNLILLRHKNKDIFEELYKKNAIVSDWRMSEGIQDEKYIRISIGKKKYNNKLLYLLKKIN